jgi:hypothetical protein
MSGMNFLERLLDGVAIAVTAMIKCKPHYGIDLHGEVRS